MIQPVGYVPAAMECPKNTCFDRLRAIGIHYLGQQTVTDRLPARTSRSVLRMSASVAELAE